MATKKKTPAGTTNVPLPEMNPDDMSKEQVAELALYYAQRRQAFTKFSKVKRLQRVLRGMASGLCLGDSRKISVTVNDRGDCYTDGKNVVISMISAFLGEEFEHAWGVLCRALFAHEVSHVNHSEFKHMAEIRSWYEQEMNSYGYDGRIGKAVASNILNMVEDGRIEQLAVEEHPGLFAAFRLLNKGIRDGCKITRKATEEEGQREWHDFTAVLLSHSKTGLYPDGIEHYADTELEEYVIGVLPYINNAIVSDAQGCFDNVKLLLTDIAPYLDKLLKNSEELQQELQQSGASCDYEGASGAPGSGQKSGLNKQKGSGQPGDGDPADEDGEGEDGEGSPASLRAADPTGKFVGVQEAGETETGVVDAQGTDYSFAAAGEELPEVGYSEAEIQAMEEAFENDSQMERKKEAKEQAEENQSDGPSPEELDKMLQKAYGNGNSGLHVRWPAITPQPLPADIESEAKILRKEILKTLEARNGAKYGCKSGFLDTTSLWKAGLGVKDLFYQPAIDKSECAFYLDIDLSGSMSEGIGRNASKSFVARRTAAVIEEVSRGLFPTKIALFNTAGGGASHMCIKPFESKGKINFSYSSLNSLTPGGCNEDSVHIRVAAMELAKRKEKRKILFVLSDGLPSAYANRGSAEAEVRKAVDDATRMGIVVIPIMFGDMDEMQRNMRSYNAMYPKNLIVCEPKEISKKLPLVFRQLVLNR